LGIEEEVERLYVQLNVLVRRSRELSNELHPGLSLVGYTFLTTIEATPDMRASDLADRFGMDKSVVSRQLDRLTSEGLLRRSGGRPGRRGDPLSLTRAGRRALAVDADRIRTALAVWLGGWPEEDVAHFSDLLARFNASLSDWVVTKGVPATAGP
jgi:DNA-binding MarR family transcriptional regulator